jgi:hypothetical protein
MKEFQIDCTKFLGVIKVDDNGIIIEAHDICKCFVGQPMTNLQKWIERKFGYFTAREINE